jgi:DNA-3-methyladenine glycosylase I
MAAAKTTTRRCDWALAGNELYVRYHDTEWGVPVHDERKHFEFLVLEAAQAGLSWATVLNKREAYRKAFSQFDPAKVARYDERRIARLLENPGLIRNRLKLQSAVTNARAFLAVQDELGSFDDYIWSFVDGRPVRNRFKRQSEVPASTPLSDAVSRDMKKRGFKFCGTTIVYAHLQATGIVNDHLVGCFRHRECTRATGGL